MSALHAVAIVVHVVTAVLGLGLSTANAIAILYAAKNPNAAAVLKPLVLRYFSVISASLALMILSGIALDIASQGAWDKALFFRGGFLAVIVVGALSGVSRARLRKSEGDAAAAFAKIGGLAWAMCVLVGIVAIVMVLKPG